MQDKKEAYEVLGLPDGASKDEILKRYDILLKKHRTGSQTGEPEEFSLEEVNNAYNLLMGYQSNVPVEPTKPNPVIGFISRQFKLDEKKLSNFFHYYKIHIIVAIIAVIVLGTTIRGCVTRVDPDFYLTFIGDMYVTDTEQVGSNIKSNLPDIKAPQVDLIALSEKDNGEQAYAMQMKAMAMMAAGDMDLIITDKINFERYAKQEAFIDLADLAKELGVEKEKNKDYIMTLEGKTQEGFYGINISDSTWVKEQNIKGKELIASIRINAKNHDKAVEALKLLIKK